MRVTITVGSVTRSVEVPSDLLDAPASPINDERQRIAQNTVSDAFVKAYIEEVRRAEKERSRP